MSDKTFWKYLKETQEVVQEIKKELNKSEREILEDAGILLSPDIAREYARAMGYFSGLRFVLKLIEESEDETT